MSEVSKAPFPEFAKSLKKKQTYAELQKEIEDYLDIPHGFRGYFLPRMLSDAAVNLFTECDCTGELAQKVRHHLKHLEEKGHLDVIFAGLKRDNSI